MSALIFSPTQSITRRQFKEEVPTWIETLRNDEAQWDPTSRIYESSSPIYGLTSSCCGTWIASAHLDTVNIWDIYSGKIIRVLDATPGAVKKKSLFLRSCLETLACFSPWNREELVSSCCEYQKHFQLLVWDVTTGKLAQQLRIRDRVVSISYMNSARHILGYLSKKHEEEKKDSHIGLLIASFWNTKTGQIIKKIQLQEPSSQIQRATFSPNDGNNIAWFRGSDPEINNIDTGSTTHIHMDHIVDITQMKFSPDGSFLVSHKYLRDTRQPISFPKYISVLTLSDASSGETNWSFQIKPRVLDMTFSPDGKLLAIATWEGIELFSTLSGRCLHNIITRSRLIIFSSDGSKIFSVLESAVSVIDISQESFIETGSGNSTLGKSPTEKYSLCISPNGRLVASILVNKLMTEITEIGSTNSIRLQNTLSNTAPHFSPDSNKLLVFSDRLFTLWDISSEPPRTIFIEETPSNFMTFDKFSFSLDSQRLVTTIRHRRRIDDESFMVQVWNTGSGKRLMYLENNGCSLWPSCPCFSLNSTQLAISYWDKPLALRVEIWDIASNSAIQTMNLSWNNWQSHFSQDLFNIQAVRFTENGYLTLDLLPLRLKNGQNPGIRMALRTERDLKPTGETGNIPCFREVKLYELDTYNIWIKFNGKRLIWIPSKYRSDSVHIERDQVAITQIGGYISIIQFRHSELVKQIPLQRTSIIKSMPYVPDIEAFTYLHRLGDEWQIVCHDMNAPDDRILHKIESADEIKDTSEVTPENIVEHYSSWQWTVLGF